MSILSKLARKFFRKEDKQQKEVFMKTESITEAKKPNVTLKARKKKSKSKWEVARRKRRKAERKANRIRRKHSKV